MKKTLLMGYWDKDDGLARNEGSVSVEGLTPLELIQDGLGKLGHEWEKTFLDEETDKVFWLLVPISRFDGGNILVGSRKGKDPKPAYERAGLDVDAHTHKHFFVLLV